MFFDTPVYLLFLTVVVFTYWRLGWRSQNVLLLAASYFFYGWWDWRFLGLIFISTVVDYFCAHYIEATSNQASRRYALFISVFLNLGFLGFFKYFNFFAQSFQSVCEAMGLSVSMSTLQVLLPPGISFYTFQALAYIVDVYYKRLKPADSFIDYALFISLFPHLIAGPIQRPSHLLPQVQAHRIYNPEKVFDGLSLIVSGLFRKCVIADNCALLADGAFSGKLGEPSVAVLAIGTYAFAWQIYGDFSGYSNIARGSAQLIGFHFMVNFKQPYLAASLQDFWHRWHISLSTWLRDYLYIPLGGSRKGQIQTYVNLMLTMIIGGFWHGANWTFVVWGALHGVVLSIERAFSRMVGYRADNHESDQQGEWIRPGISKWVKRIAIFHVVCLGWVFFRSESINSAVGLIYHGMSRFEWIPEYATAFMFLVMFTVPLFLIDLINERRGEEYLFEKTHPYAKVLTAMTLVILTLMFAGSKSNAFIYFQF
ncbi:MAG: MBOAT family protein [Nitrospira sp.]|nr:MBOAT family protein [Nitrospira sp.]